MKRDPVLRGLVRCWCRDPQGWLGARPLAEKRASGQSHATATPSKEK